MIKKNNVFQENGSIQFQKDYQCAEPSFSVQQQQKNDQLNCKKRFDEQDRQIINQEILQISNSLDLNPKTQFLMIKIFNKIIQKIDAVDIIQIELIKLTVLFFTIKIQESFVISPENCLQFTYFDQEISSKDILDMEKQILANIFNWNIIFKTPLDMAIQILQQLPKQIYEKYIQTIIGLLKICCCEKDLFCFDEISIATSCCLVALNSNEQDFSCLLQLVHNQVSQEEQKISINDCYETLQKINDNIIREDQILKEQERQNQIRQESEYLELENCSLKNTPLKQTPAKFRKVSFQATPRKENDIEDEQFSCYEILENTKSKGMDLNLNQKDDQLLSILHCDESLLFEDLKVNC